MHTIFILFFCLLHNASTNENPTSTNCDTTQAFLHDLFYQIENRDPISKALIDKLHKKMNIELYPLVCNEKLCDINHFENKILEILQEANVTFNSLITSTDDKNEETNKLIRTYINVSYNILFNEYSEKINTSKFANMCKIPEDFFIKFISQISDENQTQKEYYYKFVIFSLELSNMILQSYKDKHYTLPMRSNPTLSNGVTSLPTGQCEKNSQKPENCTKNISNIEFNIPIITQMGDEAVKNYHDLFKHFFEKFFGSKSLEGSTESTKDNQNPSTSQKNSEIVVTQEMIAQVIKQIFEDFAKKLSK